MSAASWNYLRIHAWLRFGKHTGRCLWNGTLLSGFLVQMFLGPTQAASSSANYAISHSGFEGGGGAGAGGSYEGDGAFAGLGGISSAGFAEGTITVRAGFVGQLNETPAAVNVEFAVKAGVPFAVHLGAADYEGDPLTFEIVAGPQHGTLSGPA